MAEASDRARLSGRRAHRYAIEVEEQLDATWSEWFVGMTVTPSAGGTLLAGLIVDQAALHGLLACIRDLNLTLISVNRLAPDLLADVGDRSLDRALALPQQ